MYHLDVKFDTAGNVYVAESDGQEWTIHTTIQSWKTEYTIRSSYCS